MDETVTLRRRRGPLRPAPLPAPLAAGGWARPSVGAAEGSVVLVL